MLGIIGAMQEEIALLLEDLQDRHDLLRPGTTLHRGRLDGLEVLLTVGGIGKVNAAMTTVYLLAAGATQVIFTGVAGGVHPQLAVGDLVVSTDCIQHDVDVRALGYEPGLIPGEALAWLADDHLRTLAVAQARAVDGVRVIEGRIASGDVFVADRARVAELWSAFGAACAEMEGGAVAQVCHKHGVPFVVIRSVSDTADGAAEVDYREFMPQVARTAKRVVRGMTAALAAQAE